MTDLAKRRYILKQSVEYLKTKRNTIIGELSLIERKINSAEDELASIKPVQREGKIDDKTLKTMLDMRDKGMTYKEINEWLAKKGINVSYYAVTYWLRPLRMEGNEPRARIKLKENIT